jgi:glycosyltransferase involved in cell wall biosynthesis
MNVVHVVPRPSLFEATIRQRADALGHECLSYRLPASKIETLRDFLDLYRACRERPGHLFVFHMVPHSRVLLLSLLLRDFRYCLLYWGEDYYSTFLSAAEFERHCLAKSAMLNPAYYGRYRTSWRRAYRRFIRMRVGLLVLRRAAAIVSLCPKQFRILRHFHLRSFRQPLRTPQFWMRGYGHETVSTGTEYLTPTGGEDLRILICHSAAPTVAHRQSVEIAREYQRRWNANVTICGFLSYSGGDESDRDRLEADLRTRASFATDVHFERVFLTPEQLRNVLKQADVAVFSCLRDEGVSLLSQFAQMGGVLIFNRFSINHDFFKNYCPAKVMTHEQFLASEPGSLRWRRQQPAGLPPPMLEYRQLGHLKLAGDKLDLGSLPRRVDPAMSL